MSANSAAACRFPAAEAGDAAIREGLIMLLLAATEYARRQLRREATEKRLPVPIPPTPALHACQPQAGKYAIDGLRYQVLNALRALAGGEPMLVELDRSDAFLPSRRLNRGLVPPPEGEIVFVPGTSHAAIVGRLLIAAGCCAPARRPHWLPHLAVFELTDIGYAYCEKLQDWWAALPWIERLRIMLRE
ncbi:MAG: hypothetical protein L6Q55_13345 [Azonexus sp.]|nr:hypothetical protein [Azonexus sp.]MCK6413385.1 hypothetical protein [Azonexus sp.]